MRNTRSASGVWRALQWSWTGVFLLLAGLGGTLQILGPPHPHGAPQPLAAPAHAPELRAPELHAPALHAPALHAPDAHAPDARAPHPAPAAQAPAIAPARAARTVPRAPGAAIPPPDPALQEIQDETGLVLPRIGPDGTPPRRAYAAGWDPTDRRKRVAILLGDIGLSERFSTDAADQLPAAISFAVSPYAPDRPAVLDRIRATGHELLLALPLEPSGFGLADPGPRALLTSATAAQNLRQLNATLALLTGYVGATGALGTMRGERFAGSGQMADVLDALAGRGLLYVDPRVGVANPPGANRVVDVVLDDRAATRTEIDARLEQLATEATQSGHALGLASAPTPVLLDRLARWAGQLGARDLVLVPVSALAR